MFKQLAELAVHHSGAVELVQRLNQNYVRILMYHRFPQKHAANFDRQCAFLAERYTVVSLEEAARRLERNDPVTNLAVITIDDGYADVHSVALPILQKHRLPATLFVTTGFIQRTCWMSGDRVRYHFANTSAETVTIREDMDRVHTFSTKEAHASDDLRALLKRVPERTKRRMLSELDGDIPVPEMASLPTQYRPCTWQQLRELTDGGICIGAHTVTHPILSRMEAATEVEQEMVQSKIELEQQLQLPVELFAYPNGMPEDISRVSVDIARSFFKAAVTAVTGMNAPGSDLHALSRLPCEPDVSLPQMARLLAGPVRRTQTQPLTPYLS